MRSGACTVQQALTPEAASVVKQAVSLARRRGNAQVTPLHVASAMLQQSGSSGLLRAACLRSHSHPLQCKALELCFNVALNRLPTSTSPLLGHGHHVYYPPSLSNALVAAFKRAQAHQRRGGAGDAQQQQVLAAVKVELEQLVVSILDDPSVSRVMREAGFSSTQVKANVEHAVSSSSAAAAAEGNSSPAASSAVAAAAAAPHQNPTTIAPPPAELETKPGKLLGLGLPLDHHHHQAREEDVRAILDCMASRSKRRFMVVAERASAAEAAAGAAADKIKRGEDPRLRGVRVVSLAVSRFRDMPRDEAERAVAELRRGVRAGGVVVFVEDLAWAAEFWAARAEAAAAGMGRGSSRWPSSASCFSCYCAVEHVVAEVSALACHDGVWLLGHGTYQSYMRCRAGRPSLEVLWELQTLAVPAGTNLALSLNCCAHDSAMVVNHQSMRAKCEDISRNGSASRCLSLLDAGSPSQLTAVSTFCGDCSGTRCDAVKPLPRSVAPSSATIPHWLQRCCDQELPNSKQWSATCGGGGGSLSQRTTLNLSTVVSPSSSVASFEKHYHPHQPWLLADFHDHEAKYQAWKAKSGGHVHVVDDEDVKLVREIKVKSHDSSASNNGSAEAQCLSRFKELSAENLKALCSALEKEVPWQADTVAEIASTVLRCRSGMARRRRDAGASSAKEEDTWLFFLGGDAEGKARVARELARLVFGSRGRLVSIAAAASSSLFSPARSDSAEQRNKKRPRSTAAGEDDGGGCLERLYEAVRDDPRRVIVVEGVEQAGRRCQLGIREAIESGLVRSHGGDEAALGDAIVVLSCESFDARSRASTPPVTKKAKPEIEEEETKEDDEGTCDPRDKGAATSASSIDLNMSVENDDVEDSCCFADAGLLEAVDRAFFFRRHVETSD